MKKILYVIAQNGFRDEEFFIPFKKLNLDNIPVEVMSITKETAKGSMGGKFEPKYGFDDIKKLHLHEYQGIIIAGGPGAPELGEHKEFIDLLNDLYDEGCLICAICIAPTILAKTKFAKDKKMTVWDKDGKQIKMLESHGIIYQHHDVVVDGNIITADGPESADKFANTILERIE